MQEYNELSAQQRQVLVSLLGGVPIVRAAEAAEVDPSSVYRWLKQASFAEALREGRRQVAQQGLAQLQGLVADAVTLVREILNDKTKSANTRLRAAELVVNTTLKYLELDDLERRLRELEAMLEST